jgi:hypothetical protein
MQEGEGEPVWASIAAIAGNQAVSAITAQRMTPAAAASASGGRKKEHDYFSGDR